MKSTDISSIIGENEKKEVNMLPTRIIYWTLLLSLYVIFICEYTSQWPPDSFVTIFDKIGKYTRVFDLADYPLRIILLVVMPIIFIRIIYPFMISDPTLKWPGYSTPDSTSKVHGYVPPISRVNNKVETEDDDDSGSAIGTYIKGEMLGFWK